MQPDRQRTAVPEASGPNVLDGDVALLLKAVRSYLLQTPDPQLPAAFNGVDWDVLIPVAIDNRLANHLANGLQLNGVTVPLPWRAHLDTYRSETFTRNTRSLLTAQKAIAALSEAGVQAVVFKGPVQQQRIYGQYFVKPSGDVDLLVDPKQYRAAVSALEPTHTLDPECDSPWWRIFLGEQALRGRNRQWTTVDLHHRLQQPGCPSPKRVAGFIEEQSTLQVGQNDMPTFSPRHAMLLTCMSIVKGWVHREPVGAHLADLLMIVSRVNTAEMDAILDEAARQSLSETVSLCFLALDKLFGFRPATGARRLPVVLDGCSARDLSRMLLLPQGSDTVWVKRRRILWHLCGRRPFTFLREAAWALGAEASRRLARATPAHPTPAPASV